MEHPQYTPRDIGYLVQWLKQHEIRGGYHLTQKDDAGKSHVIPPEEIPQYLSERPYPYLFSTQGVEDWVSSAGAVELLYEKPLTEMPLLINEPNPIVACLARWRLKIGK